MDWNICNKSNLIIFFFIFIFTKNMRFFFNIFIKSACLFRQLVSIIKQVSSEVDIKIQANGLEKARHFHEI